MHYPTRFLALLFTTLSTFRPSSAAPAPFLATAAPVPRSSNHWPGWDHIDKLFVFGASYTSTGFNWLKEPSPSPQNPLGNSIRGTTSSNGPNFITYLTTTFNASKLQTYNFAYPGAEVDHTATSAKPLSNSEINKPGNDMRQQVNNGFIPSYTYKLHKPYAEWEGSKSLFISFFGINDVLSYYKRQETTTVTDRVMASYATNLDTLYEAGARNFLLLSTPPLDISPYFTHGETPSGNGDHLTSSQRQSDREKIKKAVEDYNSRFPSLVEGFRSSHPEATVFWYDTHSLFSDMQEQPYLTLSYTTKYILQPIRNMTDSCQWYTQPA
ncbi:MAG: hypothetical protein Q9225_007804, partial [Loekoesia sp. 1 TL-2023]